MIKLTSTSTEQVSKIISAKKLCRHILWQNFIIKRRVLYERVVISILFSTAWPDVKMKSSPDVDQKLTQQFVILILQLFKIADEVTKYLGNFCKRICCKGLSKVAQSGHTGVLINDLLCSNLHYSQWDGLNIIEADSLTSLREVSLYGWPPVCFVWIQLLCFGWISNIFTCLVESKPVKQDVSLTVIFPLWSKRVCSGLTLERQIHCCCFFKNGPTLASFSFIFVLSNKRYNSFNK